MWNVLSLWIYVSKSKNIFIKQLDHIEYILLKKKISMVKLDVHVIDFALKYPISSVIWLLKTEFVILIPWYSMYLPCMHKTCFASLKN